MSNMIRKYGIFFLIPSIVLGFSFLLKLAAGPYWLAPNFDPAYQYLINGLYLVKGYVPNHTDHPGTPLQILCCLVCWLFNIGRSAGDVVNHVLIAPELYLGAVFVCISLFVFITTIALSLYVFHKTNDKLAALLTQLPTLSFLVLKSWETFEPVLPVVANVFPEALLISILNLFNICLLMVFFAKTSKEKSIATLFWGFVGGLGLATKITFIPLLIIPMIVLSWRDKIIFVGMFVASFVLWTLPIVSKYQHLWDWFTGFLTHTGKYGGGKAGFIDIGNYLVNWKGIILEQWLFISFVLLAFVFVFWKLIIKKWDRGCSFLLVVTAGILIQFAIVAKHPGAHYLLPGLGLFSSLLFLIYWQVPRGKILDRKIIIVLISIGVFLGIGQANAYRLKLEGLTRDILAFHDQVSTKYQNCTFIDYYRSSDPQAALYFGDAWNLAPRLGQELYQLYPDKYFFHLWGNQIMSFDKRVWTNDLLDQNSCVIFRGDGGYDFNDGPFEMKLLEKGRFESIHLLTGTTEKQAAIFLSGAMRFFQAGDYEKAMLCALQARKFHYQPDSSIDSLIQYFKSYLQH